MKQEWIIAVSTAIFLTGVVALSVYEHKTTERIFLSNFQEHQVLHAEQVADKIETLIKGSRRILEVLPVLSSFDRLENMDHLKTHIQTYSSHMEEDYIEEISVYDRKGALLYSTESKAIGLSEGGSPFFHWAQKKENRGKLFISPLSKAKGNWQSRAVRESSDTGDISDKFKVFLAIPIYRRTPSDWKFAGVLTSSMNLKRYLAHQLEDPKMSAHHIWIMDSDGMLLFSSEHPEMVLRNIHQRDATCIQCHTSFKHIDKMLEKDEGTIDYHVKNAPRKLGAFARLYFGDLSWVVVINSPYESVLAFTKKNVRRNLFLLGTVALFFLLGSSYLIYNERKRMRAEQESKHWQELIAERKKSEETLKRSKGQLRYLSSKLLTTQEEERRRISKELHDGLGGALATLKLREDLLKRGLKKDQVDLIKECDKTIEYIDHTMEEIHRLLRNLTPTVLEHLGLSAALQWLANDHSNRNNTKVDMDTDHVNLSLSREAQITIFRIFQEAFRNTEKYADASNVSVTVRETPDAFWFSIKDDGRGFDLAKVMSQNVTEKGLGLAIMEERARMLGGHFEIWSQEGKGTRITFEIPKGEGEGRTEWE